MKEPMNIQTVSKYLTDPEIRELLRLLRKVSFQTTQEEYSQFIEFLALVSDKLGTELISEMVKN